MLEKFRNEVSTTISSQILVAIVYREPTVKTNMQGTVVITGASSGVGFSCAKEFALKGYNVVAGARRLGPMKELESYGVQIVELDITSNESIQRLKHLIETKYNGEIKYLLNNAGISYAVPAVEADDEMSKNVFAVNYFGQIQVTKALADCIIKTKGTIGFTSSSAGLLPMPFLSIYSSSKAALTIYADGLAFELEPFGVKVINFIAGAIKTHMPAQGGVSEDSRYHKEGIKECLKTLEKLVNNEGATEPDTYAKIVIKDFESSKVGVIHYYRGNGASIVRVMTKFPRCVYMWFLSKLFGLTKLLETIRESS